MLFGSMRQMYLENRTISTSNENSNGRREKSQLGAPDKKPKWEKFTREIDFIPREKGKFDFAVVFVLLCFSFLWPIVFVSNEWIAKTSLVHSHTQFIHCVSSDDCVISLSKWRIHHSPHAGTFFILFFHHRLLPFRLLFLLFLRFRLR